MALQGIIEEATHSVQFNTMTNRELRAIMKIVQHAQKRSKEAKQPHIGRDPEDYDVEVEVSIDGKKIEKLEGEDK